MNFAASITRLPRAYDDAMGAEIAAAVPGISGDTVRLVAGAAGTSPYLGGLVRREADWLGEALAADPDSILAGLLTGLPEGAAALGPALRRAKRRLALYVALADLGGVWPLERVTGALTALADRALQAGLTALLTPELARGKLPGQGPEAAETGAGLCIFAMGKMGAGELNYSSDIDLIVLYDDAEIAAADRPETRAALTRVTRRLVSLISDRTDEGYVFRTDLRLRPDASVTPVCLSMDAAEQYYESVGRSWERAAWIKARPAAGDLAAGARFLDRMRPFVWRRHLDFWAIEDAHEMRRRIHEHHGLHGEGLDGRDIKLAPGGIREIEFSPRPGS